MQLNSYTQTLTFAHSQPKNLFGQNFWGITFVTDEGNL